MSTETETTVTTPPAPTTTDPLLAAVRAGVRVHDLGRPLSVGMSQSPNHPPYWHSLPRRHGDMVRELMPHLMTNHEREFVLIIKLLENAAVE